MQAQSLTFREQLDHLERQLQEVSRLAAEGDALALEGACATLRQLSIECAQALRCAGGKLRQGDAQWLRMQDIVRGLDRVRGAIARRAAMVDQTLRVLVPGQDRSGYGAAKTVYASGLQRSGTFSVLRA